MNNSFEIGHSIDKNEGDFFAAAFQNGQLQLCTMTFTIICLLILIPIEYGMIWFEHYGSDKKRTLINRMFASACWTSMQVYLFVIPLEMVRYVFGPLPGTVCFFHLIHKNVISVETALFSNGVTLSRYLYVFYLKNPSEFQDEFWHTFINLWVGCFGFLSQFTFMYLPGHQPISYYICIGIDPKQDGDTIIYKKNIVVNIMMLLSVVIQVSVAVRFIIHRVQIDAASNYTHKESFLKEIISDFFIAFGIFAMSSLYGYLLFHTNNLEPALFNVYPNYLFLYSLHFFFPLLTCSLFAIFFYVRNKQMGSILLEELFEFYKKNL